VRRGGGLAGPADINCIVKLIGSKFEGRVGKYDYSCRHTCFTYNVFPIALLSLCIAM
jgi:hypothetical protein